MSCNHTDPCKDPCNADPCYDNCGCLNPTTFECVSKPGNHHALKVSNDMNGKQVLSAIDNKIAELEDISGKVSIDHEDFCPGNLINKIEAGQNISITQVGEGCNKKLVIRGGAGIGPAGSDINVKVSPSDTTSGLLNSKVDVGSFLTKTIIGGTGNQKLRVDLGPLSNLLSTDSGNALILGADSKLKTSYVSPNGSETKIQGAGVISVTGSGTNADPYVIFTNPSIFPLRASFDGKWKPLSLTSSAGLVIISSDVHYRFRFDGTIEFKGVARFNVTFSIGTNSSDYQNLFTFPIGGTNPISNPTEISRDSVMKSIYNYSGNSFTGYNIYLRGGKLGIKFTFTGNVTTVPLTYIVDFDSASYHLDNI
jgi:hypothetical protein